LVRGDDLPDIGLVIACERNLHTFVQEAWPTVTPGDAGSTLLGGYGGHDIDLRARGR